MSPVAFAATAPLRLCAHPPPPLAAQLRSPAPLVVARAPRRCVAMEMQPPEPEKESKVARAFDVARNLAHKAGITSDRVRHLAEKAMGHKAEALSAVEKVMGKAGLDPAQITSVTAILEKVDLTTLVVDGDSARATLLDVERVVKDAARGEAAEVQGALSNFVRALDRDGDGHVSKGEIARAVKEFGSVAKAIAAAGKQAAEEGGAKVEEAFEEGTENVFPAQR